MKISSKKLSEFFNVDEIDFLHKNQISYEYLLIDTVIEKFQDLGIEMWETYDKNTRSFLSNIKYNNTFVENVRNDNGSKQAAIINNIKLSIKTILKYGK